MGTQDDQACLLCHNEIYLNPNMKLMMAVCGHKFCESCVTLTFLKSVALNCPDCQTQLKKNSFVLQSLDDSALQKNNAIRKKILKIFNKRREDFPGLTEYNDYLETVEDIIFNLLTNTDVEATNERVKKYQIENSQAIIFNQSKKASEDRAIAEKIKEGERLMLEKKKQHVLEDQEEAKQRMQDRLTQIHAQSSDKKGQPKGKPQPTTKPAQKEETKEKDKENVPTDVNTLQYLIEIEESDERVLVVYRPSLPQPNMPSAQPLQAQQPALAAQPLTTTKPVSALPVNPHTREKAGGYREEYIKQRALEEAFSGLWLPTQPPSLSSMEIS